MRSIAILLLTYIAVFSQPAKPEEFSVIEGRVLNSTTGDPLAKAALTLSRIDQKSEQANWEQSYAVTSDAAGKFLIRNIAPGRYRLRAKRNGFLDGLYPGLMHSPIPEVSELLRVPDRSLDADTCIRVFNRHRRRR